MPSLISLFCGPGGFDQGFREAGFTTKLAYDADRASIATHIRNHPKAHALLADLSTIDTETIIEEWNRRSPQEPPIGVIGGPPCQSFSVTNVFQTDDDPRHELPKHYARIIKHLNDVFQIDFFVFENVPGLISPKHIDKFDRFSILFQEAGFNIFQESLDAQDFGVPQRRKRIFVIGINKHTRPDFVFRFPKGDPTIRVSVAEAIGALTEPVYFSQSQDGGVDHPNHWCMTPKSKKFTEGSMEPGAYMGRSFRVLKWTEPSYTVAYGHNEVHIHPQGHRRLSVYEAMLLQSFPREYVLEGTLSDQIRLVSEAVSIPVARALAETLVEQLNLRSLSEDVYQAFLKNQQISKMWMNLTPEQWKRLASLIPERQRPQGPGRPPYENQSVLNGILWILRSGEKKTPKGYPSYQTCQHRLEEWTETGVFLRFLEALANDLRDRGGLDPTECFIDNNYIVVKTGTIWQRLGGEKIRESWQLQTALIFMSPFTLHLLSRVKSPLSYRLSPQIMALGDTYNPLSNGHDLVTPKVDSPNVPHL